MSIALPTQAPRPARTTLPRVGADVDAQARVEGRTTLTVFAVSLLINLAAAIVVGYVWSIGNADALSRTTNAWYVLFSRDPHLAAAGFVWPVLPSLVELPFLPLLRALGHQEFAGYIMSALSGAGTLAVLSRLMGSLGITGWTRLSWLVFVQFHPEFLYISANGMAEAPSMLFLTLALFSFLSIRTNKLAPAALGLCLAGAFFVRYEVLATMAASALALFVLSVRGATDATEPRDASFVRRWLRRVDWATFEGRVLVAMVASAYAIGLWLVANWMIMGDPLYFNDSTFSLAKANDVAKNYGPSHPLYQDMHSVTLTLEYALRRLTQVNVTLPVMAVVALWIAVRKGNRQLLGLVVIIVGTFGLTTLEVYEGTLPPYLRYWSLAIPFGVVLAAACVHATAGARWARVLRPGIALLLLVAAFINVKGLGYSINGLDEIRVSAHLTNDAALERHAFQFDYNAQKRHDGRLIAAALDAYSAKGLTMIDTETGFAGILWTAHPERLVISSDRDFAKILVNPRRKLRYIVVTDPHVGGDRDFTNGRFPGIFDGRVPWARYVGSVRGTILPWRVYKVVPAGQPLPVTFPLALPRRYYFAGGAATPASAALELYNRGPRDAHAQLTVYSRTGARQFPLARIAPGASTRVSIGTLALAGVAFGLAVAADRPMTVRLQSSHTGTADAIAIGTQKLDQLWYFAEGSTNPTFEETIALLNVGDSVAHAQLRLLPSAGSTGRTVAVTIPPHTNVAESINALLPGRSLGVVVTADHPLMAERTMSVERGAGGTAVTPGIKRQAQRRWRLRGGTTLGQARTYLAILNPTGATAHLTVRLLDSASGQLRRLTLTAMSGSRATVALGKLLHAAAITSEVTSDQPVVVEQAIYRRSAERPLSIE